MEISTEANSLIANLLSYDSVFFKGLTEFRESRKLYETQSPIEAIIAKANTLFSESLPELNFEPIIYTREKILDKSLGEAHDVLQNMKEVVHCFDTMVNRINAKLKTFKGYFQIPYSGKERLITFPSLDLHTRIFDKFVTQIQKSREIQNAIIVVHRVCEQQCNSLKNLESNSIAKELSNELCVTDVSMGRSFAIFEAQRSYLMSYLKKIKVVLILSLGIQDENSIFSQWGICKDNIRINADVIHIIGLFILYNPLTRNEKSSQYCGILDFSKNVLEQ